MPYVESRRACHSRACYKPHSHPTASIGAVDQGTSLFTGAGDAPVALHAGTLVFVPASRVHACNPASGTAWSYQMVYLDPDWLHAVRREYAQSPGADLTTEPVRITAEPGLYARFCRLNTLLFSSAETSDKEAALIEFIGDCDTEQEQCLELPNPALDLTRQLQPILEHLQGTAAVGTSLSELAKLSGMSRYQLIRTFRAGTGMTPHAWQLNLRINLAKPRILAGDAIAGVAHDLGFADQAHFQRVFKAHTGITPGRFRA
ncbi:AraC family transcriptional regulator [Pseudomonas sp. BMS12]|uniref:AraC family transcriptional regulator n=1 Tax=Pseudomonas sp. BMS12 TaxID=1796033 RepID=UPI00083BA20E|nr:AraC family transcriptional regulator [Pseudomonas sp. BMS12]